MATMRCKLRLNQVIENKSDDGVKHSEKLRFSAVAKKEGYGEDGLDENNTFAKWSPSASFEIDVHNPALFGKLVEGEEYYVDFTKAE